MTPRLLPTVGALAVALTAAACGSTVVDPGPRVTPPPGLVAARSVGPPEGRLRLLAPAGYVPAGAARGLGCDVTVDPVRSSDELVAKLSSGRYDGALGTADATVRLLAAGKIAPVNTALLPNYGDVYDGLKDRQFNSAGQQTFAVPAGRAANLLLWRSGELPGSLASLGAVLDRPQAASVGERITVPDDPANIAEAALWVALQRPALKITDPYELDGRQFRAAVDVLRRQSPYITEYWRTPADVRTVFRDNRAIVGLGPQATVGELQERPGGSPIRATLPREGSTGISPAWMIASGARHPNCMYRWLDRSLDPTVNARVAQGASIAPASRRACEVIARQGDDGYCSLFHADDDDYYARVLFRTRPLADCGDARGRVCVPWAQWVRAWGRIVGQT